MTAAMLHGFTIEEVSIDALLPDPCNPRRISDSALDALTRNIKTFGFLVPIVARRIDGMIISGHQRLLAARRLGLKTVPVVFVDLPLEEARLLGLALNRISGEWDKPLLGQQLKRLGAVPGLDLLLSGFLAEEIRSYLKLLDAQEKRDRLETIDLDAALRQAYEHPRASRGERFALGDHRLFCGDATVAEDVARLLDGQKAALAVTDPPYNVSLGNHGGRQRGQARRRLVNDSLTPEAFESFCRAFADNLIANVEGALYVFMSSKELPTVSRALAEAGAHWSDTLIWRKDSFVLGRAPYQRCYEPCWFGWPEGVKPYWAGGRKQADVWDVPRPDESPLHPTQKPLGFLERALRNSSKPGNIVLNLFLGSGSTIIACERTGRICYGLELDPHYASLAIVRWEAFTGHRAEKVTR